MTALKSTHECPLRVKVFSGLAAPGKFSVVSSSLLQLQATVKKFILVLRQDRELRSWRSRTHKEGSSQLLLCSHFTFECAAHSQVLLSATALITKGTGKSLHFQKLCFCFCDLLLHQFHSHTSQYHLRGTSTTLPVPPLPGSHPSLLWMLCSSASSVSRCNSKSEKLSTVIVHLAEQFRTLLAATASWLILLWYFWWPFIIYNAVAT